MEAVHVTSRRVLVILSAGQVDPRCLLDSLELDPQRRAVVRPREYHRLKTDDLLKMLNNNRVQGDKGIPLALVVRWRVIAVALSRSRSSRRRANGSEILQPVMYVNAKRARHQSPVGYGKPLGIVATSQAP